MKVSYYSEGFYMFNFWTSRDSDIKQPWPSIDGKVDSPGIRK